MLLVVYTGPYMLTHSLLSLTLYNAERDTSLHCKTTVSIDYTRLGVLVDTFASIDEVEPPRSTQPGHPFVGMRSEHQRKLGLKQAHSAMHWPRVRGLAV